MISAYKTLFRNEAFPNPNGNFSYGKAFCFKATVAAVFLCVLSFNAISQNTWTGSNNSNWNNILNWSWSHVPLANENVLIPNGSPNIVVNTNAVCNSIQFASGGTSNSISINAGQSLTVTGAITINAVTTGSASKIVAVGSGTLTAGSVSMASTANDIRDCELTVSTGTINISGDITMDGTSARNAVRFTGGGTLNLGGNFTGTGGGSLIPGTGTVNLNGASTQVISGANTTSFHNLIINKSVATNTVTSVNNAFSVANDLTVTRGNLILQASNANYSVSNDVTVTANGTLTHSVNWDATGRLFSVGGNFVVTGIFSYTTRSHVQMNSASPENISTGSNTSSAFSILTLLNGAFSANNTLRINDNFWAMFNSAGSFRTNGQAVYANGTVISSGGNLYVNGGSLDVNGGLQLGSGIAGTVTVSSGTLNADNITLGAGGIAGTVNHTGGTVNLSADLTITNTGSYICTGAVPINIAGDWINNRNATAFTPSTSTITFTNTTSGKTIRGTAASQTFNNLNFNSAGQQIEVSGATTSLTVNGSVTLSSGTFTVGTATTINVAGGWTNTAGSFSGGTGAVVFNGTSAQTINGPLATSFNNVVLNNSNGVTLSGCNVNILGNGVALTLTNGKISTGANRVIMGNNSIISGADNSKYIYGNLQMGLPTGSPAKVFEIGDATTYAPVSVTFHTVTVSGGVMISTTGTEHPNIGSSTIDPTLSVNRFWRTTNVSATMASYSITFNFQPSDIDPDAGTNYFILGRRTTSWSYPTITGRTATSISTGLGSFGDCALGTAFKKPVFIDNPDDVVTCSGLNSSFTAVGHGAGMPTAVWQMSTDNGISFNDLTIASPYSVTNTISAGTLTTILNIAATPFSLDRNMYRAVMTNSLGSTISYDAQLLLTQGPGVNAGAALTPICSAGASAPLGGSVSGSATGGIWSTTSGGTFTPNATALNATWTPPGGFTGTATLILTTTGGTCASVSASKTQIVGSNPPNISVSPASSTICNNAIQALTVSAIAQNGSSGTVNLAIPNNNATGVASTIALSGIPAGVFVRTVSVTFNVTHPEVADLIVNLRAPDGSILNLANRPSGGAGTNFTNTVVRSTGTTAFSAGTSPFTAAFQADAVLGIGATGQTSNVTNFNSLLGTLNGNWALSVRDAAAANSGSLASWSISIEYNYSTSWTPVSGLYTNSAATVPYISGNHATTVYAKPPTGGTYNYVASSVNSSGCRATGTGTVITRPAVTITTDYCYGGGLIQLTANSSHTATSYLWNTGATTQTILVDVAGLYQVTVGTAGGCFGSASASIAQELVVNGDFSAGNAGFTSAYAYQNSGTGGNMYPEGTYTVNSDPSFHHGYFFGRDHTSNSGNFMIVNGSGSPVNIWQQTMAVQPNTTYYFSAWAISLNDVAPYAQLQFNINGSLLGTTAVLASGPTNNNPPYNWIRFYGSWTSGPAITSATVSIRDLQTALGGNDFGLDDISFGTLSTFITHTSASGTDSQTVCKNTPMIANVYAVGSGIAGPTVTGLPAGVTSLFNGVSLTISGTPTTIGNYTYSIATTGTCNPVTAYGFLKVTEDSIKRTSAAGTDSQTVCMNTAATPVVYTIGRAATGATVSGLPTGITGMYNNGVFTISGAPATPGIFDYTVMTTGGCVPVSVTGRFIVQRQIITRTSGVGTNTQTVCVNTPIDNITYALSGTATGAGVTGLPTGVTGNFAAGVFTISGTPSIAGVFLYTVTSTGTCASVIASGTVTVTTQVITLSSAAGSSNQTACLNAAINNITYNLTGTATGAAVTGLPSGVSGSYASGVITISGNPTVTGVFTYTITTTGTCAQAVTTGTITVTTQGISLSSAPFTSTQSLCVNTALTSITYAVTGSATGAGATGLPPGVMGNYSAGTFVISGTPTLPGSYSYTVTTTGGCVAASTTGTITVTSQTIALTSAVATTTQSLCVNTVINNITYSVAGTATGATVMGLPAGVNGIYSAGIFTISGTPTVAGIYPYTITTSGTCNAVTAAGTITVRTQTIILTSTAASAAQAVCLSAAISNITYSVGGTATGAGVTGLPAGLSGNFSGGTFTISGVATVFGVFSYTVTTTGTCTPATAIGTITVTRQTIALASAAATTTQSICVNASLTNITYAIAGTATGAGATGLPPGVTGSFSAGVFTISGIPTVSGIFPYIVTTTGTCTMAVAMGTITVTGQTIALTSAGATAAQTICINTSLTNITYAVGGTGVGASVTGLPPGITGNFSGGTFTISGTATVAGVYSYTVTTSGTCTAIVAMGTITVSNQTLTLTSAAGTSAQTVCINTAIVNIVYANGGTSTGAGVTGLPPGVTGNYSMGIFTISGTPTVTGIFSYTVTSTGTCAAAARTGTITVGTAGISRSSAAGTDAQTVCMNTAMANITYSLTGLASGATVTGLPTGITGAYNSGVFTISGMATVSGNFSYTVVTSGSCAPLSVSGSISVTPAPNGGSVANATVCYADNGTLTLSGHTGSVLRWESSLNNSTWTNIANTTATQTFTAVSRTTWYRALLSNGGCAATAYSNHGKVMIHNLWTGEINADWHTGSNWSDGVVPTTMCPDVTIPILTAPNVYPQLTSGLAATNNLVIQAGATMIVSNAVLQVAGTINNSGTLIVTNGTLELNGTTGAQSIAGSIFSGHTIKNLIISNSNNVNLTGTNDTLRLTGLLSFGVSNATLNANGNLTLVSNAAGTASVGDLTNGGAYTGNNILGNVTVERFIPLHPKAWQFLAIPTSGQSIRAAWQEGNAALGNSRPGYGTTISGHMSGALAAGFDMQTISAPSMKSYNSVTNQWEGVSNTSQQLFNKRGFMFFVRGDRSVTTVNQSPTETTLRSTGQLFTIGANAPASSTVLPAKMEAVGNPYASAIDFRLISKPAAPDVDDVFYVWDPLLTNNYNGLGGYQTISAANGWKPIPGGTSNYDATISYPFIQSGQAFFTHATGAGGSISFQESCKVVSSALVNRDNLTGDRQFIRMSLYNASGLLCDGNVVAFDENFSNNYEANDALKILNTGENIGIMRTGKFLALEARAPVTSPDTVFYTFNNLRRATYQLRIKPEHIPAGMTAELVDNFTQVKMPVSMTDSTMYSFFVSDAAGTWAADRFSIIFKPGLPPAITQITAARNATGSSVAVRWTVKYEAGIRAYDVQRSFDGTNFTTVGTQDPLLNNYSTVTYQFNDAVTMSGAVFYRIKGRRVNADDIFSGIVRLGTVRAPLAGRTNEPLPIETNVDDIRRISIFPNPVVNHLMNVSFHNLAQGNYTLKLINVNGQPVYLEEIKISEANQKINIRLPATVAKGNYELIFISKSNRILVHQVIIR